MIAKIHHDSMEKIKSLINEKLRTYNAYCKNVSNSQLHVKLQQQLSDLIDDSKRIYFLRLSEKLNTIQCIGLY